MSSTLTPSGFTAAPAVPQADGAGQIVGLNLQNAGGTALNAQPVTFGQVFKLGSVMPSDQLTATIGGQVYAVQMDVKTTNADGSVGMAVLTVDAPPLAANATSGMMLSVGGTPNAGLGATSADLQTALQHYDLTATLDVTANEGGATGLQTVNIGQAVASALQAGTATMWLNGALAQEAVVSIPVTGSLRIEADVTAYANGTIATTLQFNNDAAMQKQGGTITYSTSIAQNGVTVATQASLTQYQYQDWSMKVGTAPSSAGLNIQHDVPYLEATGAVPNYDSQYGVASGSVTGEAGAIASQGWNAPLGSDFVTQYMPMTGGRGDIGPTTQGNATWLITQNASAAAYALGQATEAGSVPWHFYDPSAGGGMFVSPGSPGDGNVWTDPRGGPYSYTTGLTQQVNSNNSGWVADQAHMPDLSYVAYIQTGNVQYLEQLNAQASFALANQWPGTRLTTGGNGVKYNDIIMNGEQVRGSAWSLRAIQEAAYANPVGSSDQAYYQQATNDNYTYVNSLTSSWTKQQGQAYGYLPGAYGDSGAMAPWQQDYLASAVIQGAELGVQGALTFLHWESNYLVGRFFAEGQGFNPENAFTYNVRIFGPNGSQGVGAAGYYQTWSQIEQGTVAMGQSNVMGDGSLGATNWAHAQGDYGALALQTLSGIITVSTSSAANAAIMGNYQYQAMQAFGWLLNSGAPFVAPSSTAASTPQFSIDPRLANGQLLSFGNVTISADKTPTLLKPVDPSQNALLYAGAGSDTLIGGTGINLMFGGSGADTIIGGPNGNDIFAGAGDETIVAGGGATFIQASSTALLATGTGSDLFVIDSQASGAVTISGFDPSLDHIDLVDGNSQALSASAVASIIGSAQTISGGVLLHVSATETVTIETTVVGSISGAWFQEQQTMTTMPGSIGTVPGSVGGGGGGGGGGGSVSGSPMTSVAGGAGVAGDATISGGGQQTMIVAGAGAASVQVGNTGIDSIAGGAGPITIDGGSAGFVFQAGNGAALVDQGGTAGNAQIISGIGNMTINAGTGYDYVDITNSQSASSVVIDNYSFGHDPINYTGFANHQYLRSASFNAHGGTLTLVDGQTVQLNYADSVGGSNGGPTTLPASHGQLPPPSQPQIVTLNQAGQNFVGGSTQVVLADQSGFNTITGGSGGLSVTDSAGHDVITTNSNASNILNLANADTVVSTGRDMITMAGGGVVTEGDGQLNFVGGANTSTIFGGAGAVSATSGAGGINMTGGAGAVVLIEGSGADQISAGSGNMTLMGGTGTLTLDAGGGNTLVNQTSGNANIKVGGGNIVIDQGTGFDNFSFTSVTGGGSLTINNFNAGRAGFTYTNVGLQSYSFGASSDQMTLTDGTRITMNIAPSAT